MPETKTFLIDHIPTVLYGAQSERLYLSVHGKAGCKEGSEGFAAIACKKGWQVLAIDLPEHGARRDEKGTFYPWIAVPDLQTVMEYCKQRWPHIALRASSIGVWFSMLALADEPLESTLFVSPILDMNTLIADMMGWAGVTVERLEQEGTIPTSFGETLSWRSLTYAKAHPITAWRHKTAILYAGKDNLTARATVDGFTARFGCGLTVMPDGEHWFHTKEQLAVLDGWYERML